MITITLNKVAGFEPRWTPFAGFSVLFDNPGNSLETDGDLSKVACAPTEGGALDLYSGLAATLNELDRDLLTRTYLFCPLPPSSYHVTVWDGINADNIQSVDRELRSDWSTFLDQLPHSLNKTPASMEVVKHSALCTWSGNLSFQFDKLALWGNQALVARLQPVDETSKQCLNDLSAYRSELSNAAEEVFGVSCKRDYSPHISLGYFANQEYGQLAQAQVQYWTERFSANLKKSSITYSSLDIYGFTDMVSFFK